MLSLLRSLALFVAKMLLVSLIGMIVVGLISWGLDSSWAGYASALRWLGLMTMIFAIYSLIGSVQGRNATITAGPRQTSALHSSYHLAPLSNKEWSQRAHDQPWGAFHFMLFASGVGLLLQLASYLIRLWLAAA